MNDYLQELKAMKACQPALDWLEEGGFATLDDAWQVCQRGDWLLWLVGETTDRTDEAQLRRLTLAKARCAGLVKHLMKDERSIRAVEVAERFGMGEATHTELDAVAADDDAYADAAVAYAAYAAAAIADDDDAYATYRKQMLARCAVEVRNVYPHAPELGVSA